MHNTVGSDNVWNDNFYGSVEGDTILAYIYQNSVSVQGGDDSVLKITRCQSSIGENVVGQEKGDGTRIQQIEVQCFKQRLESGVGGSEDSVRPRTYVE